MSEANRNWIFRLLRWFCPEHLYEEIEGDLIQKFRQDEKRKGTMRAKSRLIWNTIRFFRPGIVLRNNMTMNFITAALLGNYFRISWRYLSRNKTFAVVNVLGLALGMAAALLVYEYVRFEKSFDQEHVNAKNIYRITTAWNPSTTPEDKRATTVPWSGPGVKDAFPEVEAYTRFASLAPMTGQNSVRYDDKEIKETNIYLADPGFLSMFSFSLLEGDERNALSKPQQIILTESIAKKYFGDKSPLGKSLFIDTHGNLNGNDYLVNGVIKDPPANSHMSFDFLISYSSMWEGLTSGSTYWHWDNTYCYLLLRPDSDPAALEKKITEFRAKKFADEFGEYNDVIQFKLQPLQDIHLYSSLQNEMTVNGDGRSLLFLIIVGISILLSAYTNYINLSTVKAVERRMEIGIRKVIGSSRKQLVLQLFVESLVINSLAVILAFGLARVSAPAIGLLFNMQWPEFDPGMFTGAFLLGLGTLLIAGTLLSSLYPAIVLTSFRPAEVLKGSKPLSLAGNRWTLRKSLTVLQFVFCLAFITGTFVMYMQLRFMKDHDLGMNMSQVVTVQGYGFQKYQTYKDFKARLSSSPMIQSVSSSSAAPGDEIMMLGLRPKVKAGNNPALTEVKLVSVDEDFFKTLDVTFLDGRTFNPASGGDRDAVIINEAAMHALGYADPQAIMQQPLHNIQQNESTIVGVIKNYHQRSLKSDLDPLVFVPNWLPQHDLGWNRFYYFVRLEPGISHSDMAEAISKMNEAWKASGTSHPFSYFFLDDHFDQYYKSDTAFTSLFMFFSGFAIFIACLGLFGLVAYTTLQRTREIGIRKVLGASVRNILTLLSGDFVILIVIAALIAIPVVVVGLQQWLQSYAFRVSLQAWMFMVPLLLVFVLAFTTVVLRSLKVAVANPVDSIRYE